MTYKELIEKLQSLSEEEKEQTVCTDHHLHPITDVQVDQYGDVWLVAEYCW